MNRFDRAVTHIMIFQFALIFAFGSFAMAGLIWLVLRFA